MKKLKLLILAVLLIFSESQAQRPQYRFLVVRNLSDTIGTIDVQLFPTIAPLHVRNFDSLVNIKLYDSTAFHRVIPGFVIQGGDPNSKTGPRNTWGQGQASQQEVPAEFNPISHQRGIFSAARDADPNSATSQFFICVAAATHLDWNYTAYGKTIAGMNVVDNIVVSPRDANDNPFQKIEMFVSRIADDTNSIKVYPQVLQPLNNAKGISASYLFKWNAVPNALMYELEFSKDSSFTIIDDVVKTAALQTTFSGVELGEQKYFWRIKANDGGYVTVSPTYSFSTGLFAPALLNPANNSTLSSNTASLEWQNIPSASSYRVVLATSSAFTPSSIRLDSSGIIGNSIVLEDLIVNRKYYWKVASEIDGISGDLSTAWAFTTGLASSIEEYNAELKQQLFYPNPSKDFIVSNTSAQLKIFTTNGQLILDKWVAERERIDVSALSAGVYVIEIIKGAEHYKTKLMIAAQ